MIHYICLNLPTNLLNQSSTILLNFVKACVALQLKNIKNPSYCTVIILILQMNSYDFKYNLYIYNIHMYNVSSI